MHDTLGHSLPSGDRKRITAAVLKHASFFKWQRGDVLLVDNIKMAHGRMTFTKPRKILTSMIGLYDARDNSPREDDAAPYCNVWPAVSHVGADNDVECRDPDSGELVRVWKNAHPFKKKIRLRWVCRRMKIPPLESNEAEPRLR